MQDFEMHRPSRIKTHIKHQNTVKRMKKELLNQMLRGTFWENFCLMWLDLKKKKLIFFFWKITPPQAKATADDNNHPTPYYFIRMNFVLELLDISRNIFNYIRYFISKYTARQKCAPLLTVDKTEEKVGKIRLHFSTESLLDGNRTWIYSRPSCPLPGDDSQAICVMYVYIKQQWKTLCLLPQALLGILIHTHTACIGRMFLDMNAMRAMEMH